MKSVLAALTFTALAATTVQAEEVTWSGNIRGVFEKHCIGCHGSSDLSI